MRIFFAFSTGAMMGRILAKLLKRKDVDITDMNEMRNISQKNPDELQKAQRLIASGGVFEKFIGRLFDKLDSSYKTQFVNWAWVALADSNAVFDRYVQSFDENGVVEDSHHTGELFDTVSQFCIHMTKHADFRQECRQILQKVNSKKDHVTIDQLTEKVNEMNYEWNSRKKYIVNSETIEEAWQNIERNRVNVQGSYGQFVAYEIPSWSDLMQTCHQTNWCVARKGQDGENYYKNYGAPYYLICDGRRNPFALLNPKSGQYKDIKDYPVTASGNSVLPSHRRAITFGKAVLDAIGESSSPRGKRYNDFSCFSAVDRLEQMDEEDRNDRTDYDAIVDAMPDDVAPSSAVNQFSDEFAGMSEHDIVYNLWNDYEQKDESWKREMEMVFVDAPKTQNIPGWLVTEMCRRGRTEEILKLLDQNRDTYYYGNVANRMMYYVREVAEGYDYRNEDVIGGFGADVGRVLDRLYSKVDDRDRSDIVKYSLISDSCPGDVAGRFLNGVDIFSDFRLMECYLDAAKKGKVDIPQEMESRITDKVNGALNMGMGLDWSDRQKINDILRKFIQTGKCSEQFRRFACSISNRVEVYGERGQMTVRQTAIAESDGSLVDGIISRVMDGKASVDELEGDDCQAMLMNRKCDSVLVHKVLSGLDYGAGYRIGKYEDRSVYKYLFKCGKMTEEDFMRLLKTNPRIVVRWGWESPHCTDVVKLALAKKIGKVNGQLFHFGKDENPLVLEAFFNSRLSAGRYAEYVTAVKDDSIPDKLLATALIKIDVDKANGRDAIDSTAASKNLSAESMRDVFENRDKCKSERTVFTYMFQRKDVPWDIVKKAFNELFLHGEQALEYSIGEYIQTHGEPKFADEIRTLADVAFSDSMDGKDNVDYVRNKLMHNNNCPEQYVRGVYESNEKLRKGDSILVARAIREKWYPVERMCKDLEEYSSNYYSDDTEIFDAIVESSKYTDEEKTVMLLKLNFSKISISKLDQMAGICTGSRLFKKVAMSLSHENDHLGKALAENKNYTKEQIASIINRNYGVTEGYYRRFGVDENVLRSKHLYTLIKSHYSDFSKQDRKTVLHCDNEDAVWMMKKYIREDEKTHRGVRNSSRMHSVAMRVALDERMNAIARRIISR